MDVNSQTSAILLLTVSLGKSSDIRETPLTSKEWSRLAAWLRGRGVEPSDLLQGDVRNLLAGWVDRTVTAPRVESLLGRGGALGLALERWQRAGLWVLTEIDPGYPERLKRRLGSESPPVLFGCGKGTLLEHGGLTVVGSRDASKEDLSFAERLGAGAAGQGFTIVSGGARGVDQAAMFGALYSEGTAVGVLAESLLRSATSAQYRKFLLSGDLVLVSPSNPELGFDVGKAMSRNRYVYCLGDAAIVISSTAGKGGTWNGAIEAVREGWVPVWVKRSSHPTSGNSAVVARGAHWLPTSLDSLDFLLSSPVVASRAKELPLEPSLFASGLASQEVMQVQPSITRSPETGAEYTAPAAEARGDHDVPTGDQAQGVQDFYEFFLIRFAILTANGPLQSTQIAENLSVVRAQVDAWLKRGVSEGVIKRLRAPTRYRIKGSPGTQASLLPCGDP